MRSERQTKDTGFRIGVRNDGPSHCGTRNAPKIRGQAECGVRSERQTKDTGFRIKSGMTSDEGPDKSGFSLRYNRMHSILPRFIEARGYCGTRSLIPRRCPGLLSSALSGNFTPAGSEARHLKDGMGAPIKIPDKSGAGGISQGSTGKIHPLKGTACRAPTLSLS